MRDECPQVSVIIPTYDRAAIVVRAVESALALEGVTVEVIVVDDGSTDDTPAVLRQLVDKHGSLIRVIRQSNAGASAARNTGLDAARGSFVQFLDSDDTLFPDKVARQVAAYKAAPEVTVVLCHGWLETAGDEERIGLNLGPDPQPYLEAMCGRTVHVIQTSAPLWRRGYLSSARRWDPEISLGDDLEFHLSCLADADRIAFVPDGLFTVHHHDGDRLSDFSHDAGRLASLLETRVRMYDALVMRDRWTEACRLQMASALRSIYAVCLTRMGPDALAHFETEAARICGPTWRGRGMSALSGMRRLGGPRAVARSMAVAWQLRTLRNRLSVDSLKVRRRKLMRTLSEKRARPDPRALQAARDLLAVKPAGRSALFVELNAFHAETVPGYVALLAEAGFEVTVLHRLEADVPDALCRLPQALQPARLVGVRLGQMKSLLSGDLPGRFDLVVLGSGTLSEPDGYFGSALDFLGTLPEGRLGHLIIEHAVRTLLARGDKLRSNNLFGLREMQAGSRRLPMLAPVEFGPPAPAALSEPVRMAVVGRLTPKMRDVEGLFAAVRQALAEGGHDFEIQLIGGGAITEIPEDIRPVFRVLGRLSFPEMFARIDQAHVLLPLLCSQTPEHRGYLARNTTGTRQLSLGFHTPMVLDMEFARAYGIDSQTGVLHQPHDLAAGLRAARALTPAQLMAMQQALAGLKKQVKAASLENLRHFLDGRRGAG